ncbi:class I SAM-dependent methyltransferase [soil metagenome]
MDPLPEHVRRNRARWDEWAAVYAERAPAQWAAEEISWGIWGIPEAEVQLLPDVAGMDVIELGCGTAYVAAWLARRGARPVGLDNSPRQLETARALQRQHGLEFPLVLGYAEDVPLPDASFDLAISEYGAATWADPYGWIPEAARLLRPGGRLIFLGNATLLMLCVPDHEGEAAGDRLRRDYFGLHRLEWPDGPEVEFNLGYGEWISVLRQSGFEIEGLVELRPPAEATTTYDYVTAEWARRWPSEQVWKARRR